MSNQTVTLSSQDSTIRKDFRKFHRHLVNLDCTIFAKGIVISGKVINISMGGAGIRLYFGPFLSLTDGISGIEIDDVGWVDATLRWQASDRLGVSFNYTPAAQKRVEGYFARNNLSISD